MTPALSRAIVEEQWTRVLKLATPSHAQHWTQHQGFFDGTISARVLPLHQVLVIGGGKTGLAIKASSAPTSFVLEDTDEGAPSQDHIVQDGRVPLVVVQALVRAYPASLSKAESSYERLPLHCLCRKPHQHVLGTVQWMLQEYPHACLVPDALERLPLHYALSNGAPWSWIQALLLVQPKAAQGVDIRGFAPLHVACAHGASPAIIRLLLQAYPEAVWIQSKSGISIRHCLSPSSPTSGGKSRNDRRQILQMLQEARRRSRGPPSRTVTQVPTLKSQDLTARLDTSVLV